MSVEWGTVIALTGVIITLVFNIIGANRIMKKDASTSEGRMAELLYGVNSLRDDIEEIKANTKDSGRKIEDLSKRVILLEYKTKNLDENKGK